MALVHARDWAAATQVVDGYADPVAAKLVTFYRLLAPGAANADEIDAFALQNPDWPSQDQLERRRQEAIASDADQDRVRAQCGHGSIELPTALQRCAEAFAAAGQEENAASYARRAWILGFSDPGPDQTSFVARWKSVLRPEDEWERFARLVRAANPEASRQIARLVPGRRGMAHARLALQRGAPDALALADKLSTQDRSDPGIVLAEARWLRHQDRQSDAVALWRSAGEQAEQVAGPLRPAFRTEREALARALMGAGKNADALTVVSGDIAGQPADAGATFLAGFILLERLHQPQAALAWFQQLADEGTAVITAARAHYWLARARAADGDDPKPEYTKAAAFPTTFYGQLASLALGQSPAELARRIDSLRDPSFTPVQARDFTAHELVRAGAMLAAWGEFGHARAFLQRMAQVAPDPAEQEMAARLALGLGLPDAAVSIARHAGLSGLVLPVAGWPMAVIPPEKPVNPAVTLAVIRQESGFDTGIISPAGARGLMQLMPATAALLAQRSGEAITPVALTTDPARNMELGTGYLSNMLDRFGGSLPLALAAYNAGPHRVSQWLAQNGDPRVGEPAGASGMIDWIEMIPLNETRNYVQRVLESVVIYAARRGEREPPLIGQWSP